MNYDIENELNYWTSILTAMTIHAIATYGDNLSPAADLSAYSLLFDTQDPTYPSRHPEQTQETTDTSIGGWRWGLSVGTLTLACFCPRFPVQQP